MNHPIFLISAPGGSEWILILLAFILYFLPTIIAANRKKSNTGAIFVLNLFLGWTMVGWIISLVWALSSDGFRTPTVVVNNNSQVRSQEYKGESHQKRSPESPETANPKMISQQDKIDQLRQLKQLLDEGVLTVEEFNKQKAAILG